MKKVVVIIIMAFLFTVTVTSYAEVHSQTDKGGTSGALYGNKGGKSNETGSPNGGGLFRSPEDDFGERPGGGGDDGAIGQDSPVRDGLPVLIACCLGLIFVKVIQKKKKEKENIN